MTHKQSQTPPAPNLTPLSYGTDAAENLDAPVVRLEKVCFAYDGQEVLTNIDLTLGRGDFLAVIGPNGGGKTTLVKIIMGLLRPRSGTVRVLGMDPATERPKMGYVPQHANVQLSFPITVLDVVLMGLERTGRRWPGYTSAQRQKALDMLHMVDMADYKDRRFDALSGGQKQRVLVGRGLVSEPQLLVFDEPTSNMDPHGKVCLFELLAHLRSTLTILMVSHDLISASGRISGVAAVNRHLIQRNKKEMTPEMLQLIYGTHDATCPLDVYLKDVSIMFEDGRRHD